MRHLGIDYGTSRVGVALSDEEGRVAFPHGVIEGGRDALSHVAELVQKNNVQKIVIGESRNFKNEPNDVMEDIEQFKKDLEELTHVPVEYQQEFFTSTQAARQFEPDDSRKKNPSQEKLDASAAALILQSYLDTHIDKASI